MTTQTNIGLTFGLFEGALTGSVDYFYKNTTDVLLQLTVADPISPTTTRWDNIDMDIINEGVEIELLYRSSPGKDLVWELGGNATFLDNRVENAPFTFLATGDIDGPGLSGVSVAGIINDEPVSAFFLREHIGFDEAGNNIFRDQDGDGVITANDRVVSGSPIPDFTYNLFAKVSYKGFTLTANFNGVTGNQIYNNTANAYFNSPQLSSGLNIDRNYFDERENPTNSATESTRYLEDGDFFRLNNATLRYNVDARSIPWVQGLGVFVTGQNLFTITDYTGFDPVVDVSSDVGGIIGYGIDHINIPRPRTIMVGLDFSL